jgi:hypothetical protein
MLCRCVAIHGYVAKILLRLTSGRVNAVMRISNYTRILQESHNREWPTSSQVRTRMKEAG